MDCRLDARDPMPELPLPEHDATSIVLIGAFNPRIFHPAWFVRNHLLPVGDEVASNIEIVNNDVCAFETDWFRLEVLGDRFILRSMATPAVEALRDLVLGTFRVLRHTPIQRIGLNTHAHFALPEESGWHRFGHMLAPKPDLWEPILKNPGTLSLTIEGQRPDDYAGHVRAKVEPSARIEWGIFFESNDEYQKLEADSADWLEDVLLTRWDSSRSHAMEMRQHVLGHAYDLEDRG